VKQFVWEPAARSGLRRLDRDTAMRALYALTRYGSTGEGNVKRFAHREGLYRLRSDPASPDSVRIHGIDDRGEAY
jgi:hypothetical protein